MEDKSVFLRRIDAVRAKMAEDGTDLLILVPSSYMKYLAGYSIRGDERFLAFAVPQHGPCFAVANALYEQQLAGIPADEILYWADGENAYNLFRDEVAKRRIGTGRIALDPNMPARFSVELMRRFPESRIEFAGTYIDGLRICKDEEERSHMREACRRADIALERTIADGMNWIGRTEEEFLARLVYEMTKLGIQNGAACVCVGENASVPHHHPGSTKIGRGSCLLVDFGGDYCNYNTDMTRNFYFGEPSEEYQEVYRIVLEALEAGKRAVREGCMLQEIDRAVRGYIAERGYGKYFTHRTGHGIGLDCHEGPSVMEGETFRVRPGMAFSIEPGIYLPGRFGVRIEDQILVTENGAGALHRYPLALQVIRD